MLIDSPIQSEYTGIFVKLLDYVNELVFRVFLLLANIDVIERAHDVLVMDALPSPFTVHADYFGEMRNSKL